ncbi:glycosyltransferase family 2 protein, partial [Mammaliicoccus sciuri]|uniref:glycosyltransferase family 2 protein n=3 Tax=Staphylococcaceae TaxID=90964 RepID=UPI000FF4E0DD
MNKLSIIITYYNNEEHILDCIESIKKQRNQNFDLIIVDDGSTDSSANLIKDSISDYDKSITYIKLEYNSGHAYARNKALEKVNTQYLMFLDADDQLASYAVEYYLSKVNGLDGLIAPIHKFTINKPQ